MTTRDPYIKNVARFDKKYDEYMEWFAGRAAFIRDKVPPDSMPAALSTNFESKMELLTLCYSRGDDLSQIKAMLPSVLDDFFAVEDSYLKIYKKSFWSSVDNEKIMLSLMGFCYCLGLEEPLLHRFLNCFLPEGEHRLIDRLIAVYQPERKIADLKTWGIVSPGLAKEHRFLNDMIDAPQKQRTKLVNKHLKKYDKKLKNYKQPLDKNGAYIGIWSFDVALVVKAFNLDDSEFKDSPFYPSDLVHYQDKGLK